MSNTSDTDQKRIGVQMNVQVGAEAGQTVPHFHMHVIPLFVRNTEVECEEGEWGGGGGGGGGGEIRLEDENRKLLIKMGTKGRSSF